MDYALLNLAVTLWLLAATFAFRKRILSALGRLLFDGAIEFARATLIETGTQTRPDGSVASYTRLRPSGEALVGAVVPVFAAKLVQWAKANVKLNLPGGPGGLVLTEGADLMSLAPQFLGMLPKRYQGLVGLALPFLQQFLGGQAGKPGTKSEPNPFLKELQP